MHPHKSAYFLNSPHARTPCDSEIVFGYTCDNIFRHVKQGHTYICHVKNGVIVEMLEKNLDDHDYKRLF